MGKTAIVLGATGLTGNFVLEQLIEHSDYEEIRVFSRSQLNFSHPKVKVIEVDLLKLSECANDFVGDEIFCCIGTTKKKTPNKENYRAIDVGIPISAAKLGKQNGVSCMVVISAIGANSKSWFGYNRMKGEMEQGVIDSGIERVFILRPSVIAGNRVEKRVGEKMAIRLFKLFSPFLIGGWRKYRAIESEIIAKKMIQLANSTERSRIVESNEIEVIVPLLNVD